jgi:POT family proton-dependent oligopeptide transporter
MSADTLTEGAPASQDRGFFGHPRGLANLFMVEFWERFSYYGMRGILVYFLMDTKTGLRMSSTDANSFYSVYSALVYMLALPGGWIADRLLGARRSVLWGGITIACGHYVMAVPADATVYLGLLLIAVGTGLLKPNISDIVGKLYRSDDERRDAGFTIFYMAINIGAFLAPLIVGTVGQHVSYHLGFSIAAAGMTLGVIQYVVGGRRHLGGAGRYPATPASPRLRRQALLVGAGVVVAFVGVCVIVMALTEYSIGEVVNVLSVVGVIAPIAYFSYMLSSRDITPDERTKLWAYLYFFVGAVMFWMIYDQGGSLVNVFGLDHVNWSVFGWQMPSSWSQSFNPVFIIIMAPLFARLWQRLGDRQPRTAGKFGFSLLMVGLSFGFMALASWNTNGGAQKVTFWWLVLVFAVQTVGELCLSPVGLSVTTKLAPEKFGSQMLGLWFLATAVGDSIGAQVVKLNPSLGNEGYYGLLGGLAALLGVVFLLCKRKINTLMGDVR